MAEPWAAGILLLVVAIRSSRRGTVPGLAGTCRRYADDDATPSTPSVRLVALGVPVSVFVVSGGAARGTDLLDEVFRLIYAVLAASGGSSESRGIAGLSSTGSARRAHGGAARAVARPRAGRRERLPHSSRSVLARTDSLVAPTPWYYWQQSLAIAKAGRFPRRVGSGVSPSASSLPPRLQPFTAAISTATSSVDFSLFAADSSASSSRFPRLSGSGFRAGVGRSRYAAVASAIAVPTVLIFAIKPRRTGPRARRTCWRWPRRRCCTVGSWHPADCSAPRFSSRSPA